ncbi:putative transmembrane emp24 domain-containing protein p24delta4-like [Capsicum annuum]|uniref:uncharacterized protein LOC107872989 isoform X1 n=2 Tax=Capsicum annuum TaxID=4072 RepID=UPI001FB0ED24|nr:uncharacterized protein LOC107872989 isoform X1 [Capsicum annuum]KAF3617056.1 putative transmembrane emp24 domain-containing protein p24delta4-like [Capsicum annuum]
MEEVEGFGRRHKLVQSTLFPNSAKQIPVKGGAEVEEEEEEDAEEEERCASQENGNKGKPKPRKKRNPKATTPHSNSRASKKVAVNGRETSSKEMPDGDSPVIIKNDFFLKRSEKKNQKRQQTEQLYSESPEKIQKTCSPPEFIANKRTPRSKKKLARSTPEKCQMDNKARKNMQINGLTEACLVPRNLMQDESMLHSIPDLRMEAKKTAEENSRRYAGKQIHPFFQSLKMGKKSQEVIDAESNWYSSEGEGKSLTFSPIHVFELVKEDETAFDWGDWIFSEACFLDADVVLEFGSSSLSEDSVSSLQFDNMSCISHPKKTLSHQNNTAQNQHAISQDEVFSDHSCRETKLYHSALSIVAEEQVNHFEQLKNAEVENVGDSLQHNVNSSDTKKQGRFLQERIVFDYQNCPSQPKSCLWTNKYQPERAFQVCGNSEPVKLLSDWLHLWHEKASRTSKSCIHSDSGTPQEFSDSLCESEADSTNEEQLKNVLLVSGPVGSGKSAAIYACAKEQGFQVIEVNASDWRNGALVKQRFGEAVESHWLQRVQKDLVYSEDKLVSGGGVIEPIPLSDEENAPNASGVQRKQVCREEITVNHQGETKTLILFEDVDTALCEDRGFVSTIQQLAETAKRPMILTSNSQNPVLPNNLDRLKLCFVMPSLEELLGLAHMVCAGEQVKIHPMLVERFVDHCQGDIRKTIMYLQFWCQGQTLEQGGNLQLRYSPLQFDLDAGHLLLPKIIPWDDLPSPLSELVDEEITKSIRVEEESDWITEKAEEDELINTPEKNNSRNHDMGANNVNGKKNAMLSLLYSFQDHNECTIFGSNSEFSDASESPIAFTRRNMLRKLDRVMSSDSEEECSRVPLSLDQPDTVNEEIETACSSPSHFSATEISCSLSTENLHFKAKRLKRNYLETTDYSTMHVVSKSVNVSCVPESSFIPETQLTAGSELISTTESYNDVDVKVEANYCSTLSLPSMYPLKVEKLDETVLPSSEYLELQGCSSDRITKSIPGEVGSSDRITKSIPGEVGCSDRIKKSIPGELVEHFNGRCMENVPSGYRVLDECSRMDFSKTSTSFKSTAQLNLNTSVQETWRRLREGYLDLKQYITPEQKESSQILNVAHEMSDLISVADLLLTDCNHLLHDSLELSVIPIKESHSYNWHDNQLKMFSVFAQHGVCFFAKEIASLGPSTSSVYEVDLTREMLASTNSTMALGKMVGQSREKHESLHLRLPRICHSFRSKVEANAYNLLQSVVPLRSHIALKGDSFHEYLSSLSQISRFGTTRLLESIDRRQRRGRAGLHYLSSGRLALSQDDVSLLGQYNCYQKVSPGSEA